MARAFVLGLCLLTSTLFAQSTGSIRGTVTLESNGQAMHSARVVLMPLGRSTETGEDGAYEFRDLPAGNYTILVSLQGLTGDRKTIQLTGADSATADFKLKLAAVHEHVTVTASGREEATLNAISSVTSLDTSELTPRAAPSLGDVLENEPGIAKRSFGPGNTRPVVRGFDGDRVLVLEDGIRTGSLSSQSGDHGEPIDAAGLDRLEVVRGPATLLYGSNAIGGVVNAISRASALHDHPHDGLSGYLTGYGGSTNGQGGGSAGFDYGVKRWQLWASGGGQRTGDYDTPLGTIRNSDTRSGNTSAGFGRFGERGWFSTNYLLSDARYGIPSPAETEENVALKVRRHSFRFNTGIKDINSYLDRLQVNLNYTNYNHKELEDAEVGTQFFNEQIVYRVAFDQKKRGRWLGSFGVWGLDRDYRTEGEESLAPPTRQTSVAVFAVQSLEFEKTRLQFGGRIEHNGYSPQGLEKRGFTGFSGAAGISQQLAKDTVFVANYTHSYRAPALEELYNVGPHPGNATFEIGNPELVRERSDGIDISVRHHSSRLRAEVSFFNYRIDDYVFLAPTGNFEDGLIEAEYAQARANYRGGEARLDIGVHPNVWLNTAVDGVHAELHDTDTPLPRIPPVRGRVGLDFRFGSLSVRPELVLSSDQSRVFPTETRTAGYGVFNLNGSYTIVRQHSVHTLTAQLFNAGDRLYRNHLSFIKEFAPEIGRGVRFSYTMRFF